MQFNRIPKENVGAETMRWVQKKMSTEIDTLGCNTAELHVLFNVDWNISLGLSVRKNLGNNYLVILLCDVPIYR